MDLSRLSPSPSSGLVNLLVEIPAGSRNKYRFCHSTGLMVLDRVLHSAIRYPFDYGFVPNTLAADGSPLDAMVIMAEPTFAGCLIRARPIGLLDLKDNNVDDAKLLCVPDADPGQREIHSIRQIAPAQLEEVAEFFRTCRSFEGRSIEVSGWRDAGSVPALLDQCIQAAN
jgi:inorganic pyrophosphatase